MKFIKEILVYESISTEEIGIMTELAICEILDIPFNTKRKNKQLSSPEKMKLDLQTTLCDTLKNLKISHHQGNANGCHDFLTEDGDTISLKTNISNNKVCPQNIGQISINKFSEKTHFSKIRSNKDYKKLVFTHTEELLELYLSNLFCCKYTIYIHYQTGNVVVFEKMSDNVSITLPKFKMSKPLSDWAESNTLSVTDD